MRICSHFCLMGRFLHLLKHPLIEWSIFERSELPHEPQGLPSLC